MSGRTGAGAAAVVAALLVLAGWWLLGPRSEAPVREPGGTTSAASDERAQGGDGAVPAPAVEPPPDNVPSATVESGIRGIVVDAGGAPASGATVRLSASSTTSDAVGAFSLPLSPDTDRGEPATLLASKDGHGTAQVEVRRGGPSELRVVLPPAAEVAGVVTGPAGPLAGARVVLRDGAWERAVETDIAGTFRFPEARTTPCTLVATAKDHRPAAADVSPGLRRRTIRIDLQAAVEEFALRVVDEHGGPVAGATVTLRLEGAQFRKFDVKAVSDASGVALRLPGHCRGMVSVEAPGFAPGGAPLPWVLREDVVVTLLPEADLEVRASDSVDPQERRAWAFALGWNAWRDPNEPAPESGFGPRDDPDDRTGAVYHDRWVEFDADGRARLPGAATGRAYSIVALRRDASGASQSFRLIAWKTPNLPPGRTVVEWAPPAFVPVRVRIEDESTAAGVSGKVHFELDADGQAAHRGEIAMQRWGMSVRTGSDGIATAWLWPGTYRVTAYGGRGISHEPQRTTSLAVGETGASATLRLPRGSVLRGRLRAADGTPLSGRQVHLYDKPIADGFRLLLGGTTDDAGRFEVFHVPDGEYEIWAQGIRADMTRPTPARVTTPCEDLELVVTGCTLRGEVRPVPDGPAVVQVAERGYGPGVEEPVDDTGAFEVQGLSPGPKTVVVRSLRGEFLGTAEVTVADGAFVSVLRKPPPEPEPR